jgi:1-acyl-sn-glycerol-3-phosphate acyltransferase
MIAANQQGLGAWLAHRYVDAKVRRTFRGVWVRGTLPPITRGTVVYANHSSFWDGFALHQLGRAAGWELYCLMEERQLARYRFLARLGAFSIRRGDPESARESLRYARSLLQGPRAVLLFPEGQLHGHRELRPLERGVEVLARAAQSVCLPVALRYVFFEHELPDILVEVGDPHGPAPLTEFSKRLSALRARLESAESTAGFARVVRGRRGVAELYGRHRA